MIRSGQRISDSVLIRLCRKILLLILIIGIPVVLFLFTFGIKKVDIVGTKRYTNDQIKEFVLKSRPDYNSLYLYLKYRFFEQPEIPFVEKLDVKWEDTHRVTIYVYEKMVAGCVEFMGEYLYFDKDGIVVESSPDKVENVPVIKGLQFNEIILNQKLKVQKDELFDIIINLTQQIEKYQLDVDTISFDSDYEVTAKCGDIKVLLGKKDTYEEALSDLKNILKKAKGMNLSELDMRNYKKGTGYVIGTLKKSTD